MSVLAVIPPSVDSSSFVSLIPSIGEVSTLQTCVLGDGKKLFMKKHVSSINEDIFSVPSGTLLGKPMALVKRDAEKLQIFQISQQIKKDQENENDMNIEDDITIDCNDKCDMNLWVDRYAPKVFSELLSPEKINREVLKALKQWDGYVFKAPENQNNFKPDSQFNKFSNSDKYHKNTYNDRTSNSNKPSGADNSEHRIIDDNDNEDDDDLHKHKRKNISKTDSTAIDPRPKQKVILLSGPPGTGKTTLAHILARHCGYRPYEVNASDDRSADKLREIMQNCMQSNTLNMNGSNEPSKPNCIILDEIDGIDSKETINMLIQIIKEPLRIKLNNKSESEDIGNDSKQNEDSDNESDGNNNKAVLSKQSKSSTLAKTKNFPLTRPLICICNDLFTPALRELRKHSIVFSFEPPTELRLVQRLKQICMSESLFNESHQATNHQLSNSILSQLCNAAGNDIRTVINTLQFTSAMMNNYQNKPTHPIKQSKLSSLQSMLSAGLKDVSQDIFQLWNMIFSTREMNNYLAKKSTNVASSVLTQSYKSMSDSNSLLPNADRVVEIMDAMYQSHDDYDLVISGCFQNRLRVHYSDPLFTKSAMIGDWFSSIDAFQGCYKASGDGYQMRQYVPSIAAVLQYYNSHESKTKMEYPHQDREVYYQTQQRKHILSDLKDRGFQTSIGSQSTQVLAVEVVSNLIDILSPKIRPLPLVSMSTTEVGCFHDMMSVLMSYGMTFAKPIAISRFTPVHTLQLDPPIHRLVDGYVKASDQPHPRKTNHDHIISYRHVLSESTKELAQYELKRLLIAKAIQQVAAERAQSEANTMSPELKSESKVKVTEVTPAVADIRADTDFQSNLEEASTVQLSSKNKMDLFFSKKSAATSAALKRGVMDSAATIQGSNPTKKQKVMFRFNQGFSNAVKRPVTMKDFY